jgi:hypothetical protein
LRKNIPILVVGILVLSGLGAVALNSDTKQPVGDGQGKNTFTHTVFAEYGTATWCTYCRYAHGALKEIYAEGQYPFYYVSLVTDKNTKANQRCINDYNAYGWPTVWFDGGYKVNVGAGSIPGAKATYINSINSCGNRAVEDVDIDLVVSWLGGTNMEIEAAVTNNEATTYGGHLRVYITEIVSSRGWYDMGGQLYTFPFLDYAFNQVLSIPAGDSWTDTTTWDGSSHGFSSITEDNIMVIAAVFNDEPHTAYSYPPSSNPFTAYYVDETAAATPIQNQPPNNPTITGPTSGSAGTAYTYTFVTTDPEGDNVYYYVDWGDGTYSGWLGPSASGEEITQSHTWSEEGTYTIRCKAKDINGAESDWGILSITMPLNLQINQQSSNQLLIKMLQRVLNFQ